MITKHHGVITIGENVQFQDGYDRETRIRDGIAEYREKYGQEPKEIWVHPALDIAQSICGIPVYTLSHMLTDSAWIAGVLPMDTLEGYGCD